MTYKRADALNYVDTANEIMTGRALHQGGNSSDRYWIQRAYGYPSLRILNSEDTGMSEVSGAGHTYNEIARYLRGVIDTVDNLTRNN